MNYYNENDPRAAAWLNELISARLIPRGIVDQRSIAEVDGRDLEEFRQCHFFAGIGGWSRALQLAEWPSERPVWTGSCPCQPFSCAGKRDGDRDKRHLWPEFKRLVAQCRPAIVFGEQVASKDGRDWLDGVFFDLAALEYETGGADLCAACAGSPQIRQRLFWVGHTNGSRHNRRAQSGAAQGAPSASNRQGDQSAGGIEFERNGSARGMAIADGRDGSDGGLQRGGKYRQQPQDGGAYWDRFDILYCTDQKARRIEPGSFPLVDGLPGRLGLLRGYGNAIVPQVAAEFIATVTEYIEQQ